MKKALTLTFSIIVPLVLIGGGIGIYFGYFTSSAKAKHLAEATMKAAVTQQKDAFVSHGEPKDSDSFYSLAGQRNYKREAFTQDGSTFYALYVFTDTGTPAKARIGIENDQVVALSTGDKLAPLPKDDPKVETANNDKDAQFCLDKEDLAFLDSTNLYAKTFRGATMIFTDDTSTTYSGEENGKALLDRMANFYKKTHTKDYRFTIRGYLAATPDSLEERKTIIQNRATKLQQELVKRDIPEDRIDIGEPIAYPIDQPTDGQNEKYIIIDVTNNCIK